MQPHRFSSPRTNEPAGTRRKLLRLGWVALAPWLVATVAPACSFVEVEAKDGTVAIGRAR
jgi:hypothetical protein